MFVKGVYVCVFVWGVFTLGSSCVLSSSLKDRSMVLRLTSFTFFFTLCPELIDPRFNFLCLGSSTSNWEKINPNTLLTPELNGSMCVCVFTCRNGPGTWWI